MNEWISVKDRLPEVDERVLVFARDEVKWDVVTWDVVVYTGKAFKDSYGYYVTDVTHWCYLPEPPTKESDAKCMTIL